MDIMLEAIKKKIPHSRNSSKIQWNNRRRGRINTPNTQLYDRSLSRFGTVTSITSGGVKLDSLAQYFSA